MSLSPEQRREYRAIAHNLKPVIIVGDKGLSEGLQEELERALNDHELIKIKVASPVRVLRRRVGPDHRKDRRYFASGQAAQPQAFQPVAPQALT